MKVVAIDGGGIRGVIPSLVLAEIERRTGRRIAAMADLVAGTSTGAILACALAKPDPVPASQLAGIYEMEGPRIFHRSLLKRITSAGGLLDERYGSEGLVTGLERYLGDARMRDATIDIIVTAYDLEARQAVLFGRDDDVRMVDAAHASSAAPTYFEPVPLDARTLVDGGVGATNPSALAYAEARGDITMLASLGTGEATRPLHFKDVRGWGEVQWARPVVDVVFDASSDFVEVELGRLLGSAYVRLQTRLERASDDLDDASPRNLRNLRAEGEALIARQSDAIDRVCAALTA